MARMVDFLCETCGQQDIDVFAEIGQPRTCSQGHSMTEVPWGLNRRSQNTVWSRAEWATVFRSPDGKYRFPGRADAPTPAGHERVVIKSDADMARVEREAGVRSERRWYDRGSGSSFDSRELPPLPDLSGVTIRSR